MSGCRQLHELHITPPLKLRILHIILIYTDQLYIFICNINLDMYPYVILSEFGDQKVNAIAHIDLSVCYKCRPYIYVCHRSLLNKEVGDFNGSGH